MKLNLILIVISFCVSFLFGQNKQTIIQSGDYFYGSGTSFDSREARDQALEELTEQIAVRVAKSFEHKIQESSKGLDDNVKSILRTHSSATLKNVKTVKEPLPDGRIKVFCYLSKQEVVKIFNERKQLIYDMYQKAKQNGSIGNYANSLKLYYFSMLLLNSLPEQNVVYKGINFTTDIPEQINRIISDISFQLVNDRKIVPILIFSLSTLLSQNVNKNTVINSGQYYFGSVTSLDARENIELIRLKS